MLRESIGAENERALINRHGALQKFEIARARAFEQQTSAP